MTEEQFYPEEYYKTERAKEMWRLLFSTHTPDFICYVINTYFLPKDVMLILEQQQKELKK